MCRDSCGSWKPPGLVDAGNRVVAGRAALTARGQVDPRLVRQQRVLDESVGRRRSPIAWIQWCRREGRSLPASRASTPGRRVRARSQTRAGRSPSPPPRRRRRSRAGRTACRCCCGGCGVGSGQPLRQAGVEDRRHRLEGRVVDGEARCGTRSSDARSVGEVREARGVDLPVGAERGRRWGTRRGSARRPAGAARLRGRSGVVVGAAAGGASEREHGERTRATRAKCTSTARNVERGPAQTSREQA